MNRRHVGFSAAALTLLVLSVGCRDREAPSCEDGCADGTLCWYALDVCIPEPGDGGTCPEGHVYRECATSSCPTCRDCVAACVPERIPAAASERATDGSVASSGGRRSAPSRLQRTSLPESRRASSS